MNLFDRLALVIHILLGKLGGRQATNPALASELQQTFRAVVANQSLRPAEQATILAALRAELLGTPKQPLVYRAARHWFSATVACALTILSLALPWQATPVAQATVQALPAIELTSNASGQIMAYRVFQSATPRSEAAFFATPVPSALNALASFPAPSGTLDMAVHE